MSVVLILLTGSNIFIAGGWLSTATIVNETLALATFLLVSLTQTVTLCFPKLQTTVVMFLQLLSVVFFLNVSLLYQHPEIPILSLTV